MMAILKLCLTRQFNIAILPLTPTLSRARARELILAHIGELKQSTFHSRLLAGWLKPRNLAIMPSPAGGRGCATAWVRGKLPEIQKLNHAK